MTSDDKTTPNHLAAAADRFATLVSQFLIPIIRYVGHKDTLYDALERRFTGLVHDKRYRGGSADILLFDHIAQDLKDTTVGQEAALLFCLDTDEVVDVATLRWLGTRAALTLRDPSPDECAWHVRALLLLNDLSYSNTLTMHPDLLSIDAAFRRAIAEIVSSVINLQSCCITVRSVTMRDSLLNLLFAAMPDEIHPVQISVRSRAKTQRRTDRINLVVEHDLSDAELAAFSSAADEAVPTMIMLCQSNNSAEVDGWNAVTVESLAERPTDAVLIAYWYAGYYSHQHSDSWKFYSATAIEAALQAAKYDPTAFIAQLSTQQPTESAVDDALETLLETYDRLSIDSVLAETEKLIMQKLKERSPLVEAASNAAGIPLVTFHKRGRRLSARSTLIGLHSQPSHTK